MDDQRILNTLSELECNFYYMDAIKRKENGQKNIHQSKIDQMHVLIKTACEIWHNVTGLNITE